MPKKMFKNKINSCEKSALNGTINERRTSTPNRRAGTPTLRTNITSMPEMVSRRNIRPYRLTKADLQFLEMYSQHYPRPEHRVRPPGRCASKKKRLNQVSEGVVADQSRVPVPDGSPLVLTSPGRPGHTHRYELAEALCKLKERPMPVGIKGQMKLIGALRKLDQKRECAWKCWMHCAMRREAEHINNMRLPSINSRGQNLQDVGPDWYQQLSWQQMETVNKLEMTLYHDIDEGTTHRTQCLLRAVGLEPPPSYRIIKGVMKKSQDDPCKFLIALYKAVSIHGRLPGEDDLDEKVEDGDGNEERKTYRTGFEYSVDERLILSAIAHLRIGNVLHCLDEEFGKPTTHLPYFKMVMPACKKRRKESGKLSTWPYLQPLNMPEYNWLEPKLVQDAIYTQNLYMTLHRVPPPLIAKLRPVPYTHIQIPEYLKPRRYKSAKRQRPSAGSQDAEGTGTKAVMSSNPHSTDPLGIKRRWASKRTLGSDTASTGSSQRERTAKRGHRRRRCRPSVAAKARRRCLRRWLKKLGESSKMCIDESSRPCTPLPKHPPPGFPQKPRRNHKIECSTLCDCKKQKTSQLANRGDGEQSFSQASDETNELDSFEVASFLPGIADEPLVKLSNPAELPPIQKWIRMKNGLIYIHPVVASKLSKRSKALWRILEGGKCSMIPAPELCLTKNEEISLKWDHIAWLRNEANRVVEEFYRTCFEMQVALAREFYPSMSTDYIRNRDKFLQIYYTYLPSRPQDCFRRPWQKSEYNHEIFLRWQKKFKATEAAKQQEKRK